MKTILTLLFTVIFLYTFSQQVNYTDSFSKGGVWYYTTAPKNAWTKNFYPKKNTVKIIAPVFSMSDTLCKEKHTIQFNSSMNFWTGDYCGYVKNCRNIVFENGWVCIPTKQYNDAKFIDGETLSFDGCKLYREGKVIAVPKHRGFDMKAPAGEKRYEFEYVSKNKILTTIRFFQ